MEIHSSITTTGAEEEKKIVVTCSNGSNNSVGISKIEINGCSTNAKKLSRGRRLVKSPSSCLTTEVTSFKDGCLPEWFLMEFLTRLPMKHVFRLKCVTRQWLSLISDPSFANFYISRASASALSLPRSPWVFLFNAMYSEGSTLSHFPEDKLLEIMSSPGNLISPDYYVLPLPNSQEAKGKQYFIKAVDNGFVLYGWSEYRWNVDNDILEYYICDPITKQWFPLPEPKYGSRYVSVGFITRVEAGILLSYKVVLIHCTRRKQHFLSFEVFSSETGEWVEHAAHSQCAIRVSNRKNPVLLNGNLHWDDFELGIIAYDPYSCPDKFRLIGLPAGLDKDVNSTLYGTSYGMCGVHQGRLKYFEVTRPIHRDGFSHLKIWVLEEYSSEHWCLQHIVRNEDIIVDASLYRHTKAAIFVSFHPYDADVVYLDWCSNLVSYNTRTRRVEALGFPHDPDKEHLLYSSYNTLCFTLVLPPWPVYIPPSLIPMHRR
ncbi:hypothetical protein ACH5RR_038096 [Cinchona calisaya]|uniref:F-box domain-containing protein n=1 Tax=Cinchona calisaya TaxID=153742 RepID=A0ABD2YB41_9GENT